MTVITRAEAEATFQAAVNNARQDRDQAVEGAYDKYHGILAIVERERQENNARAWREYEAAETRAGDECQEAIDRAYKAYREVVPEQPPGDDNKGGQP
jgi:hypothetical protein